MTTHNTTNIYLPEEEEEEEEMKEKKEKKNEMQGRREINRKRHHQILPFIKHLYLFENDE